MFTVEQYHGMIAGGVLTEDDNVELLEGWIVSKPARNPPHDVAVDKAREEIQKLLPEGWRIRVQSAITTSESEPDPDLAVVPGPPDRYLESHPRPAEITLLVEAADSSLANYRGDKLRIYARAGISICWIINLIDARVEVYTGPSGPGPHPVYRQRQDHAAGDSVPLVMEGKVVGRIPVDRVLPSSHP
jgi:hypothetical protein